MASVRGGDKFSAKLQEMAGAVNSAQSVKVGFLAGATYPDGKPVALIAAIHNWGKWPFFTNMIREKQHEWGPATGALLVANGYDAAKTLALVGEAVAGQLRQEIVDTNAPSNAPSTIRRKGFDKPLVETSHLLNSIDYEVKGT
jgi:hypothetical protein